LRRASTLASTLSTLAGSNGAVFVGKLVRDVVDVMRAELAPWASIDVNVEGADSVCVAPIAVAFVVSSLIVNALDAVRASRREGRICVRLAEHEDAVVLEVEDNGKGAAIDLRPGIFDPYFNVERANRTGLVRVLERLRRCGGDVMVDTDPSGTTVRVLFPTSTKDVVFERDGQPSAEGKRPGRSD
ncbi:MAG: sensor histidine kinase, partial [Polyangiaceae bacterium]